MTESISPGLYTPMGRTKNPRMSAIPPANAAITGPNRQPSNASARNANVSFVAGVIYTDWKFNTTYNAMNSAQVTRPDAPLSSLSDDRKLLFDIKNTLLDFKVSNPEKSQPIPCGSAKTTCHSA